MPRFGLSGEEEYAPDADPTIFFTGADSIQPVRHLNSARELQRLQKIVLIDRERRRRSAEVVSVNFDAKLAEHRAKFSPKVRDVNILERSLNTVTISACDAAKIYNENTPDKLKIAVPTSLSDAQRSTCEIAPKSQPVSSTPLPTSMQNFSFSNPSTSNLSPIPNIDNIPRFRDSLATPLFKSNEPVKTVHSTPLVKAPGKPLVARSLHEALAKSRLGSVVEEKLEEEVNKEKLKNRSVNEVHRAPTSTSVTPTSTRPSSPNDEIRPSEELSPLSDSDSLSAYRAITPPRGTEWSLSNVYYSDVMIELKSYLDDARMFEARSGITTRSLIKRSVIEKLTVTSKRHATTAEKKSTCEFFSQLLAMDEVEGFNKEKFRLREKTSVHYAMTLIVDNYLSLLERDYPLVDTISYILYLLSTRIPSFATFLTASLLSRSPSLDMCKSKFRTVLEGILEDPQTHSDVMARERAVCCLFYGLHSWTIKKPTTCIAYPIHNVLRILMCTMNRSPVLLATPFTISELIKTCGMELRERFGDQLVKMIGSIEKKLLPQLERDLETNQESRRAGNAAYISTLRSTIDLFNIS